MLLLQQHHCAYVNPTSFETIVGSFVMCSLKHFFRAEFPNTASFEQYLQQLQPLNYQVQVHSLVQNKFHS